MATYPDNVLVKGDVINEVDVVDQNDHNILKGEIIALQTYIGTTPQGNRTDFITRYNAMHNGSGTLIYGAGVQQPTLPGKLYYDTNDAVLKYIKSDNTPQSIGGSLSNVIFCWHGVDNAVSSLGVVVSTLLSAPSTEVGKNLYLFRNSVAYGTMLNFKFTRLSGQTTITIHSRMWCVALAVVGSMQVSLGTVTATVAVTNSTTPSWYTNTMNVSALNAGTTYDGVIEMKEGTAANPVYCSAIDLIAS